MKSVKHIITCIMLCTTMPVFYSCSSKDLDYQKACEELNYTKAWNIVNHLKKEYVFSMDGVGCSIPNNTCVKIPLYEIN